ncbi:S-adenosyl-L-methionine-dependent methyltransferase [Mollisia scopiformis]|uniref:S-adenosyl-L-methionine-dependent methyltransferase n=1 Tax=Mollisia scopiformis TaxID=149040 RepID=A0A132B3G3_MOLSC|nr:S-adenosyl-L-methionine-dependent methyltransferase [Mollisia scopiformis]KUJ06936.1 S-adenosyl-L-methionine-dependent methyltransferase [Mollisia scopiformis]
MDQVMDHDGPDAKVLDVDSQPSDSDSALGASLVSDTSSMRSSLYEAVEENGRTYHKYKSGNYQLPNDEMEQNRLDLQHHLFHLTFDGKLALAPISNPHVVLDMGTGTGIWAMEYATQNPSASVLGTDLSAIQPQYVPPNCRFEVDDAEDEWTYSSKFDYIHGRAMFSCFKDPSSVFKKAYDALQPGGWFEMQDVYFRPHANDDTVKGTRLEAWNAKVVEGAKSFGKDWWCTPNYAKWFQEAGFHTITERQFAWPGNSWPKGKKQKEMGMTMLANGLEGLSAVSLAVLTRAFGMSVAEVEEMLEGVRADMKDRRIHAFYPV